MLALNDCKKSKIPKIKKSNDNERTVEKDEEIQLI
jgi:hypothetical protein